MVWQWLIRGWLVGAAKQELYARAEEMLRDQLQRQQAGATAAQGSLPPPCDVGLVFSAAAEAAGLTDRLSHPLRVQGDGLEVTLGRLAEAHVALLSAGPGAGNAARGAEALLLGHRPGIVIAAGFADALAPALKRGHVVLASHVVASRADTPARPTDSAGSGAADPAAVVEFPTALAGMGTTIATRPGVHVGRVLTLAGKLPGRDQRDALGRRLGVLAAESSARGVAETCQRSNVPFLAVHVIRHGLDQEMSPELRHFKRQKSLAGKLGAALGAVTKRPSTVKEMWQSAEDALVAGDRLAEVLAELIDLLPPGVGHVSERARQSNPPQ
jgi:nucleoside phosphorylase